MWLKVNAVGISAGLAWLVAVALLPDSLVSERWRLRLMLLSFLVVLAAVALVRRRIAPNTPERQPQKKRS
jgi:hypothetical protein